MSKNKSKSSIPKQSKIKSSIHKQSKINKKRINSYKIITIKDKIYYSLSYYSSLFIYGIKYCIKKIKS